MCKIFDRQYLLGFLVITWNRTTNLPSDYRSKSHLLK